jgi:hypothetical protein
MTPSSKLYACVRWPSSDPTNIRNQLCTQMRDIWKSIPVWMLKLKRAFGCTSPYSFVRNKSDYPVKVSRIHVRLGYDLADFAPSHFRISFLHRPYISRLTREAKDPFICDGLERSIERGFLPNHGYLFSFILKGFSALSPGGWIQARCPLVDPIYILTSPPSSMSYA